MCGLLDFGTSGFPDFDFWLVGILHIWIYCLLHFWSFVCLNEPGATPITDFSWFWSFLLFWAWTNHKGGPRDYIFNDFDRFCHFELEPIIKVDPAMTFFNDFDRFCHFELEQIIKFPAITFFNDFYSFCHFEFEEISKVDLAITFLMTFTVFVIWTGTNKQGGPRDSFF